MSNNFTINPYQTSVAQGMFNTQSNGLRQGTAFPDPATRYALRGALLDNTETLPMWGGVGLYENVPGVAGGPNPTLGPTVGRALSIAGTKPLVAFSVFDQAYGMVTSPQSTVPLIGGYGQVMTYALGSRARIAVQCAPSMSSFQGGSINAQCSWDFVAQELIPYSGSYPQVTITNAVWASTAGGQTTFTVGTDISADIGAGDIIEVQQVVNTGGTGTGIFNGQWVVVSAGATTIVVTQPAASSPGTYASGGIVLAGGGALDVDILDVQIGNCMTVVYDPVTGFATYNFNGNCAVIQL